MEHDGVTPTKRKRLDALARRLREMPIYLCLRWNPVDFSYQSCRFCHRAISPAPAPAGVAALWKYGVRHYICDDCRSDVLIGWWPARRRTRGKE